uniref:Uncharacterized protein n=1 Tax=Ananas comosus var. bracteatus TaxID=296719 RepID=A0A6V7PU31_ANACO|nr:unnamed protein product [Ananas comosus var. bracteatus]
MASGCLESSFEDHDFDIDGEMLAELLEESSVDEGCDDKFGNVFRSLEAEIGSADLMVAGSAGGGGGIDGVVTNVHVHEDCEDCELDGMLSDFGGRDGSRSLTCNHLEEPFDWVAMEAADGSPTGLEIGAEWYVEEWMCEDGLVGFGDARGYNSCYIYGEGESPMEQMYSPLWE